MNTPKTIQGKFYGSTEYTNDSGISSEIDFFFTDGGKFVFSQYKWSRVTCSKPTSDQWPSLVSRDEALPLRLKATAQMRLCVVLTATQ